MESEYENRGLNRRFGQVSRIKSAWTEHFQKHGNRHVRLDQPTKNGATFEPFCHKLLDPYPDGREALEHAANTDLEAVRTLTHDIICRIGLPEGRALTERRAEHMQAVLQIGMELIKKILRQR